MSDTLPKPLPVRSERKLYTPTPKQTQVIARHLNGESRRKIARVEGIDRETVDRILSQRELVSMLAEQQSRLLRLGAKALMVCEEALECDDLRLAVATATKILEGSGVMDKRGLQGTIDDTHERHLYSSTPCLPEFNLRFERPPDTPPIAALPKLVDDSSADDAGAESN